MPTRKYVYDGDNVLLETDGDGVTQMTYTWSGQGGVLLSQHDGTTTKYYEPDGLGSTDALSDDAQAVTDRWAYRAFGAAVHVAGSDPTPFTWVGRQGYFSDSQTGLYLLGSGTRHYDPATVQFLSKDPSGFHGGDANLSRYVQNNPVNKLDPSGLEPATWADCQRAKDRVLASFWYKKLLQSVWSCPVGRIKCEVELPEDPRLRAVFDPSVPETRVYFRRLEVNQLERAIVHELVRAFDHCKGIPRGNPAAKACAELRAFFYSGDCNTSIAEGGALIAGDSPGQCLLDKVKEYFSETEKVGGFQYLPEEIICCVWDICLGGKRIPGAGVEGYGPSKLLPCKPGSCKEKWEKNCDLILITAGDPLKKWFGK